MEVGIRHTDRARFDRENGVATVQVMRKGKVRERTHEVPRDVHDLASALLALRARPPAPGARVEIPVFWGGDLFTLGAEVEGTELVDTPAGPSRSATSPPRSWPTVRAASSRCGEAEPDSGSRSDRNGSWS